MRSRPAREAKNGWPMDSNASRSFGSTRNTSSGTASPVVPSTATSKQNDRRRMSNDRAVDRALILTRRRASSPRAAPGRARGPARRSPREPAPAGSHEHHQTRRQDDRMQWPAHLPAERGPGCGRGRVEVIGWTDEAPLAKPHAVGDGMAVTETGEVACSRPSSHPSRRTSPRRRGAGRPRRTSSRGPRCHRSQRPRSRSRRALPDSHAARGTRGSRRRLRRRPAGDRAGTPAQSRAHRRRGRCETRRSGARSALSRRRRRYRSDLEDERAAARRR